MLEVVVNAAYQGKEVGVAIFETCAICLDVSVVSHAGIYSLSFGEPIETAD